MQIHIIGVEYIFQLRYLGLSWNRKHKSLTWKQFPTGRRPIDQGSVQTWLEGNGNGSGSMVQKGHGSVSSSNNTDGDEYTAIEWLAYDLKIICTTMIYHKFGPDCNNFELCIKPTNVPSGCFKCDDSQYDVTFYLANPELTADVPLKSSPNCTTYYF